MSKTKTLSALAVAGVVGWGAVQAASFEGRLSCDQDPRLTAEASCTLSVPYGTWQGAADSEAPMSVLVLEPVADASTPMEIELAPEPVVMYFYSIETADAPVEILSADAHDGSGDPGN